jgi:hypothetical protein
MNEAFIQQARTVWILLLVYLVGHVVAEFTFARPAARHLAGGSGSQAISPATRQGSQASPTASHGTAAR